MAEIYINYGADHAEMTAELMTRADIKSRIKPGAGVVIKPNLVVARPASGGATTHPEIVEGIILYLQGAGISDITIAEGSWIGDSTARAWENCGYAKLRDKYGVRLFDTKKDRTVTVKSGGLELPVCKTILDAGYLINVPVLKGHCQTGMTCCLKNMKGCIPDSEKRRYHTLGLDKPIAALGAVIKPGLHIIDGICGDLNFEEGGNPIDCGRIMLGFDPVLLDSYGAMLMGYHPDEIGYLRLAKNSGIGKYADENTDIEELNRGRRPKTEMTRSGTAKRLAGHISEDSACSACYAALVFALDKSAAPKSKFHIGQGYRGKKLDGYGIGDCASGCSRHVPGCPPKAVEVLEFIKTAR
ncbi:MAG: DUF362 domain-containing protein [Oscillospiraceae bacterium]|nr:DUF362 domain-containing protein [Oscillospiraceae bacterium]